MKKALFVILILLVSSFSFAQNKSDIPGMWKVFVKAGMKPTTPGYAQLKDDGTFVWGIDSGKTDPMSGSSTGKWDFTSENDIKITFDNSSEGSQYYSNTGADMLYLYTGNDKSGQKQKDRTTDMSRYMQKLSNQ